MSGPSEITLFIGRFHPLLIHLPIGLILLLAGLEVLARIPRFRGANSSAGYVLALAAPAALLAALFGWLLASGGGYDEQLLQWHKWTGIGTAAVCLLAALLYRFDLKKAYRWSLFSSVAVLVLASHFGGSLTHGKDYLTRYAPARLRPFLARVARFPAGAAPLDVPLKVPSAQARPASALDPNSLPAFAGLIQPILNENCVACHGPEKSKGKLRFDTFAGLMHGSESGAVLVPGKSAESLLIKRLNLPLGDEDHMPPDGKPQPGPDEIALLAWWIDAGAPADKKVAELKPSAPIARILAARFKARDNAPLPATARTVSPEALGKIIPMVSSLADELGLVISPLSPKEPWLECNAGTLGTNFGDAQLARLAPLGTNIRWLDLGGTRISDDGLARVASMPNLTRLHLEKTGVTDAGLISLTNLPNLEYLNLYGTIVTDAGLETLRGMPKLKQVYLWQTKVSPDGVKAFTEARTDQVQLQRWQEEIDQLKAKIRDAQISVDLGTVLAATAPVTNSAAINSQCPVSGKPIDPSKTVVYKGSVIAFCCDDCKAKFDQDPKPILTKLGLSPTNAGPAPAKPR